jgi:hypothetical protein
MAGVDSDVVVVTHLFSPERASLIDLLSTLAAGQWQAPTVCPGWSVKDVALHLLGDDIDLLSRRRDGTAPADTPSRLARQYTERWTHQQQIRDAVGVPGLKEPAFLAPVLATFVHALPRAFSDVPAAVGTTVEVVIAGEAGGCWVLTRTPRGWGLGAGPAAAPRARVALEAETAWRLWTKGIRPEAAQAAVSISGDRALGLPVLDAVAIIG